MKKKVKEISNKTREKFVGFKKKISKNKDIKKINNFYNICKKKVNYFYKKYKKELENTLILLSYIFIYYSLIMLIINAGIYLWYKGFDFLVFLSILAYLGLLIYTIKIKFKSPYKILAIILLIEILI